MMSLPHNTYAKGVTVAAHGTQVSIAAVMHSGESWVHPAIKSCCARPCPTHLCIPGSHCCCSQVVHDDAADQVALRGLLGHWLVLALLACGWLLLRWHVLVCEAEPLREAIIEGGTAELADIEGTVCSVAAEERPLQESRRVRTGRCRLRIMAVDGRFLPASCVDPPACSQGS